MGLRALLVGINDYADFPLRGCVNDARTLHGLIEQRYGLREAQTRLLLDAQATATAIGDGLRWLGERDDDGTPERRLFFFAGHGTRRADPDGDEPDGADECILPYDYQSAGLISDDQLHQLYADIDAGTRLLLIMDCCHAGTIHRGLDDDVRSRFIPVDEAEEQRIAVARQAFQDRQHELIVAQLRTIAGRAVDERELEQTARRLLALIEKQHFGQAASADNIVLIAACQAEETAADAGFGDSYHGVLSFYLMQTLSEVEGDLTYAQLISRLRPRIQESKFTQQPQLTCATAALDLPFLR